jgi:hypothetical protein
VRGPRIAADAEKTPEPPEETAEAVSFQQSAISSDDVLTADG